MSAFKVTVGYDGGLFKVEGSAHRDSGGIAIDEISDVNLLNDDGTYVTVPKFVQKIIDETFMEDCSADDQIRDALKKAGQPQED